MEDLEHGRIRSVSLFTADKINFSASAQSLQQSDSAPRSLFDKLSYRTRSAVKEMVRFKVLKMTQAIFCLLYTSDAADE